MRVLLDTHVFLWWNEDSPKLSKRALRILADPANSLVLSVASAWEIAIKTQAGKLRADHCLPFQCTATEPLLVLEMIQAFVDELAVRDTTP